MTQDAAVQKAVGEFGKTAKAKLAEGGQPEDQLRNPLENLFQALASECGHSAGSVVLAGEKSLADLHTRPDFAVSVRKALVGFIEVKAPGKGADPRKFKPGHDKEQWEKLKALPNLIYTDGNAFSLWRDGELVGQIVKLEGDIEMSGAKLGAPYDFLSMICDFLAWQPIAPRNVKQLAETSARLCRFLRDEVAEQLKVKNKQLSELMDDWKALLFPEADNDRFADGYAQAVTFGLLMARSRKISLQSEIDQVGRKLGESNTLIGTALRLLTEQEFNLGPALDTLKRSLDAVVWAEVSKGDPEAWLYFYEDFLEVYDNALRKATGSYYTPPEVVQAMARLCDEALKSDRFGLPLGLADEKVHIADPATGSGTYLLAIMRMIADTVRTNEGDGAVPAQIAKAAQRLYGFEMQFGAFSVAQLRLFAECVDILLDNEKKAKLAEGASQDDVDAMEPSEAMFDAASASVPKLFVTNTLADPYADIESGTGIYKEISASRKAANAVKREAPITVVIGNPPYKEKAKGKGAWIEKGSSSKPAPFDDWKPPASWGVGAHTHKLRNLYVYFWRWAAWKVFQTLEDEKDKEAVRGDASQGLVCYITVAGFLNGAGFQKMRADLRRDCDEIWVIDCSPEGQQPNIPTRIFQGVQQPVCIVLASRSKGKDKEAQAKVWYRQLPVGKRQLKFDALAELSLAADGWMPGAQQPRAPFLPAFVGGWADFVSLDSVLPFSSPGVKPGRTWVIASDPDTLKARWDRLLAATTPAARSELFENKPNDRNTNKAAKPLAKFHSDLRALESIIDDLQYDEKREAASSELEIVAPTAYGFRSFDRQSIIPDARLIDRERPELWRIFGELQVHLTAPTDVSPTNGPSLAFTALLPDQHHYHGRGGRVFPLYRDADATQPNVSPAVLAALAKAHGSKPDPVGVFAYVAGVLAHPAFTANHQDDLVRPGLRVPLTADAELFAEAAALGRRVVWLHTFGERFADPAADPPRPPGQPRLPEDRRPHIPAGGAIPNTPEGFPDEMWYEAENRRLHVGSGFIDRVPQAVWDYEVSGKHVLTQWFSYRKKDRSRPIIGDRRPPSPLGDIQPDHWLPEYTSELLNVINVLALLTEMEPAQADVLERIEDGPLVTANSLGI
ncbi:type ISP restriction/modification enzyme [Qipengyuania sp.]|uniref:type ISP restriction/modification enzyme n=1 Tax=Qipengyuania sp. TaxID=2004515 RepID=UPI003BAA2759